MRITASVWVGLLVIFERLGSRVANTLRRFLATLSSHRRRYRDLRCEIYTDRQCASGISGFAALFVTPSVPGKMRSNGRPGHLVPCVAASKRGGYRDRASSRSGLQ